MKFSIQAISRSGGRLGCLADFARLPDLTFETPLLLLHTKGGAVPNLSHSLLQMVTTELLPLQVPLVTFAENVEVLQAYGKTMSEFVGMKEYLSYVTAQDAGTTTPKGYNEANYVSVWGRSGRKQVDAPMFMNMMTAQKPDFFQILADGDTDFTSTRKRITKAVDRTLKMAEACWSLKEKSEVLKLTPMLASVEGGYNIQERTRCARALAAYDFSGYVLDGFHSNGSSAERLSVEQCTPVLKETLSILPESKPRFFPGALNPSAVLELVALGVDVFDSSFLGAVTERGGAFVFPSSLDESRATQVTETLPVRDGDMNGETDDQDPKNGDRGKDGVENRIYEITLHDKTYFDDLQPLLKDCTCYACRRFTRSYIHHLLVTGELLGPILLQMHNLHHYLNFFRNIRQAVETDQLPKLQDIIKDFVQRRVRSSSS